MCSLLTLIVDIFNIKYIPKRTTGFKLVSKKTKGHIYIYIYIYGAFNKFPDFFVQAFKIVLDS